MYVNSTQFYNQTVEDINVHKTTIKVYLVYFVFWVIVVFGVLACCVCLFQSCLYCFLCMSKQEERQNKKMGYIKCKGEEGLLVFGNLSKRQDVF